MKRLLLLSIFAVQVSVGYAQSVTSAEYFIDHDPGPGNGTPVSVGSSADTVNFIATVPTASLGSGFHFLGLRIKDANGVWSLLERRGFFVMSIGTDLGDVTAAEYFFDSDPGAGNANAINIGAPGPVASFNIVVPAALSPGFHFMGVRARDASGNWSLVERRGFYISASVQDLGNITAAEFFINTDPGAGNGTPVTLPAPVPIYDTTLLLPIGSLPLGNYRLGIRVKNADGNWSLIEDRTFTVCTTFGAESAMIYQAEGNRVFFTNQSLYYDTVTWKFGDNTIDTGIHPVKTYASAGNYSVQLITGNACGIDTLTVPIVINGLQRVNPNKAGNAGISTLVFEGFGFTPATEVKIIIGSQAFTPVAKSLINGNRIRANFDLTGFTPGTYRAMATLGSGFDTLDQALTIEPAQAADITLDISNGKQLARPGRAVSNGMIRNSGSHDAVMVPYVAAMNIIPGVTPLNLNSFPSTLMGNIQDRGIFQHTFQYIASNNIPPEVMDASDKDSARKRHIIAYLKPRIAGHSSSIERVAIPFAGGVHAFQLAATVLPPMLDSYALLDSINTTYEACYSAFLKQEVEKELSILINDIAWSNCFSSAFDTLMRTLAKISQDPSFEEYGIPMQATFSALLASMASCGGTGVPANLGGISFKRIIQGVTNNWIYLEDVDSLDSECIDTSVMVFSRIAQGHPSQTSNRTSGGCDGCPGASVFPEMCDQCLPFILAGKVGKKLKMNKRAFGTNSGIKGCQEWCETTSIDPNAKYGPGDNAANKYINHLKAVNYKVTFENLASATAPAAYVEIRDTIDKNAFDISSLNLGLLSWGDSVVTIEPNKQNISLLKSIKPALPNFLRVDITTDTAAGIIVWKFWTLDTVTLQLTANPAEGFLPPNTDGVTGAGFVTYSIMPRSSLTSGSILRNKASIIFDENAAIVTNEWEYRIDTLSPASAVDALPAISLTQNFTVSWGGSDAHSGVKLFSVYVSVNDSAYKVWKSLTDETSGTYPGIIGKTYKFFSVAVDNADNYEEPPSDVLNNPDAITSVDIGLPLDLISFTASKTIDGKKTDIAWTTVNEVNVSHFELERSADGSRFERIAVIQALNNASGGQYTFLDQYPLQRTNYYRLRMVDMDGSNKIGPLRLVNFRAGGEINVFPTITTDRIFIQTDRPVEVRIYSLTGQVLIQKKINANDFIDVSALAAGVYLLDAGDGRKVKIVKQ